jgi:diguanylate cyclase (GGDEF)-like protein
MAAATAPSFRVCPCGFERCDGQRVNVGCSIPRNLKRASATAETGLMQLRARHSRVLPPLIVLILTIGAILGVALLVQRVDSSRRAQLAIGSLTRTVTNLGAAPFTADAAFNPGAHPRGLASRVDHEIQADEAQLEQGLLSASRAGVSSQLVAAGHASLGQVDSAVASVFKLVVAPGGLAAAGAYNVARAQGLLVHRLDVFAGVLSGINRVYADRAASSRTQAEFGSAVAMLMLLGVFTFFYVRSDRLGRENEQLLGISRIEASTDALTGLGNRRAMTDALSDAVTHQPTGGELILGIFDLNGFKQYNDTFGHAAGDALLTRLGGRLREAVARVGSAYRMGGDEFCILASSTPDDAEALLDAARVALTDSGDNWEITCSQGAVWIPSEAAISTAALQIADERMYANKACRSAAGHQIADVLLQVLNEQEHDLDVHGNDVAQLAHAVARVFELPDHELQRVTLAATLHDVGKAAIPESVLNKPGPLDEYDSTFVRRHTLIGERIVLAAPALASTAPLIRSSHEHFDGSGYPDALKGEQIPFGARIIAVCDAFDAMISPRPDRDERSVEGALQELRRCAGSQFDPAVVEAVQELARANQLPMASTHD